MNAPLYQFGNIRVEKHSGQFRFREADTMLAICEMNEISMETYERLPEYVKAFAAGPALIAEVEKVAAATKRYWDEDGAPKATNALQKALSELTELLQTIKAQNPNPDHTTAMIL